MVLDDASPTADTFADNTPVNDNDPYSTTTSSSGYSSGDLGRLPEYVQPRLYPRAIPILGPLEGYNDAFFTSQILAEAKTVSQYLQRPLHPQEWHAVAHHTCKFYAITSYAVPVGVTAGYWRSETTKNEFRFPFFKPDKNPDFFLKFPGGFQGSSAISCWHFARATCYGMVGALVAKLIFASYATSTSVTGRLYDPRLKELVETLRKNKQGQNQDTVTRPSVRTDPNLPQTRGSAWERARAAVNSGSAATNGGVVGDQQMGERQMQQQAPPDQPPSESFGSTFDTNQSASQPVGFDQGNATPTASADARSASRSGPGETSWQRIRRGNAPAQAPGQARRPLQGSGGDAWARARGDASPVGNGFQGEQREGSTVGDSYSFSASEEERQLAQNEAQREFDQRVEKERQGRDFSGESTGGWRR